MAPIQLSPPLLLLELNFALVCLLVVFCLRDLGLVEVPGSQSILFICHLRVDRQGIHTTVSKGLADVMFA